jgi:hypothetical protein
LLCGFLRLSALQEIWAILKEKVWRKKECMHVL